jgi:flagellin
MASINTNYGAMVAAQSFAATGRELDKVQNRVTTGLKISSAKDNGAVWAIATTQKANSRALDAKINTLQRQQSVNDVGLAAGETIMAALTEMKTLAAAIKAGNGDASTDAYKADYSALVGEVRTAIDAAVFDGTTPFGATAGDLTTLKNALVIPADQAAWTAAAPTLDATVTGYMSDWSTRLQGLGTTAKSLERQVSFNVKLQDALEAGAGNLVDADLAKESARLTALQTKQQLGVQALSIANSASSTLLGLFR